MQIMKLFFVQLNTICKSGFDAIHETLQRTDLAGQSHMNVILHYH